MLKNQKKLDQALNRLLELAVQDNEDIDPNNRCGIITFALAILVCPEKVILEDRYDIRLKYDCLRLSYSKKQDDLKDWFHFSILLVEYDKNKKIVGEVRWLQNLAEKYSDHTNNLNCIKHLKRYLPMAKDTRSKAAVLGMAWAILQRHVISVCYQVSHGAESGHWQRIPVLGLSLQESGSNIVSSSYPWLVAEPL